MRQHAEQVLELIQSNKQVRKIFDDVVVGLAQRQFRYQVLNWTSDLQLRSLTMRDAADLFAKLGLVILAEENKFDAIRNGRACPRCYQLLSKINFADGQTPARGKCGRCHYEFAQSNGRVVASEYTM